MIMTLHSLVSHLTLARLRCACFGIGANKHAKRNHHKHDRKQAYLARDLICLLLRLRRRIRFLAHLALILKHGKELPLLVTALLFGATTQRQRTKPTRSDEYQNVIVP